MPIGLQPRMPGGLLPPSAPLYPNPQPILVPHVGPTPTPTAPGGLILPGQTPAFPPPSVAPAGPGTLAAPPPAPPITPNLPTYGPQFPAPAPGGLTPPPPTPPIEPTFRVPPAPQVPQVPLETLPPPPGSPASAGLRGFWSRLGGGARAVGRGYTTGLATNFAINTIPRAFGVDPATADMNSTAPRRLTGAMYHGLGAGSYAGPMGGVVGAAGATTGQAGFEGMRAIGQTDAYRQAYSGGPGAITNELARMRGSDNPLEKGAGFLGSIVGMPALVGPWLINEASKGGDRSVDSVMDNIGGVLSGSGGQPEIMGQMGDPVRAGLERAYEQRKAEVEQAPQKLTELGRDLGLSDESIQIVNDQLGQRRKLREVQFREGLLTVPVEQRVKFNDEGVPEMISVNGQEVPLDEESRVMIANAGVKPDDTGYGTYTTHRKATEQDLVAMNEADYQNFIVGGGLEELMALEAETKATEKAQKKADQQARNRALGQSLALKSIMQPYVDTNNMLAQQYAGMGPYFAPMATALQNQGNAWGAYAQMYPTVARNEQELAFAQAQAEAQAKAQAQRDQYDYEMQQKLLYEQTLQQMGLGRYAAKPGTGSESEDIANSLLEQ